MKNILEKLFFWRRWRKRKEDEWTVDDFVASVEEVMKQQEFENPAIRELHQKLGAPFEKRMKKIGLTGNFGTGKSTAASMFEEMGAKLLDADKIVHDITLPQTPAWKEIVDFFGNDILLSDHSLDRKKLATLIFHDETKQRKLEEIIHPKVKEEISKQLITLEKMGASFCVIEIPLLYETNMESMFDLIVVVHTPQEIAISRACKKHGCSQEEAQLRWKAQMPIEEKVKRADIVIENTGSLEETRVQVERLYRAWEKGDFSKTVRLSRLHKCT